MEHLCIEATAGAGKSRYATKLTMDRLHVKKRVAYICKDTTPAEVIERLDEIVKARGGKDMLQYAMRSGKLLITEDLLDGVLYDTVILDSLQMTDKEEIAKFHNKLEEECVAERTEFIVISRLDSPSTRDLLFNNKEVPERDKWWVR